MWFEYDLDGMEPYIFNGLYKFYSVGEIHQTVQISSEESMKISDHISQQACSYGEVWAYG